MKRSRDDAATTHGVVKRYDRRDDTTRRDTTRKRQAGFLSMGEGFSWAIRTRCARNLSELGGCLTLEGEDEKCDD